MFEINLVPDVKAELIKAQKKRNVVFFASVAVAAISAAIVVILLIVKLGQDVKINSQDNQLTLLSNTINRYEGLDELLTVQKQLSDLKTISENKYELSRIFTVLASLLESENGDEIKISSLDINMETFDLKVEGQANAGVNTDGIDFRVLESFAKSTKLMRFDYGRYVDREGREIPTMCIFEADSDGIPYKDSKGSLYAIWAKGAEGCDPAKTAVDDDDDYSSSSSSSSIQIQNIDLPTSCDGADGTKTVCIYRTPQFSEWSRYGYLADDGSISGIEHFNSQCIRYQSSTVDGKTRWGSENDCMMTVNDGFTIESSSDGKATGGELVAVFDGTIHMNPDVFSFQNKHMVTITPTGRTNVTDSFTQVGSMFVEKAKEIEKE